MVEYNRKRFQIKRRGTAERAFAKTGSPKTHPVLYRSFFLILLSYTIQVLGRKFLKNPSRCKTLWKNHKNRQLFCFFEIL
ncbi:hypothetical protein BVL54_11280 [Bacillus paralicheniformis]|nr:hypothetical protein BVL54_11280 [Bacillus paralicheniformis]